RRSEQDKILKEALIQAQTFEADPVLVVSSAGWSHGIIGIVAARLLKTYHKPTFVIEELGDEAKGSARSYGDFSAAEAIRASDDLIIKGGGHKLAAGVTLPTKHIAAFRQRVNEYYKAQQLDHESQRQTLHPVEDAEVPLEAVTEAVVTQLATLEPFGNGNPQPVLLTKQAVVRYVRRMGAEGQHVKLTVHDGTTSVDAIAFSAPEHFFVEPGTMIDLWYQPELNEWQGRRSIQAKLLHLRTI
ncbi:MAG TPA: DHHA1 domain-containing protein, partial [Patescibacteria group bacterium]|nr:DHHA1 domain-containing protein [Patescibacteria group bacterium]